MVDLFCINGLIKRLKIDEWMKKNSESKHAYIKHLAEETFQADVSLLQNVKFNL